MLGRIHKVSSMYNIAEDAFSCQPYEHQHKATVVVNLYPLATLIAFQKKLDMLN